MPHETTERPSALFDLPQRAVVYQDAALLAVDKPAFVPCQSPDESEPEDLPSLLKRRLARELSRERGTPEQEARVYLGTHQRLDRDTSGVLIYSVDREVNAALAAQFESRAIDKRYLAAVSGSPPRPGTFLEHWLVPAGAGLMRVGRANEPGAKLARTRVLDIQQREQRSLLTLAIETGRTHQIRVQLAAIGCPVVGDALYGGEPALRLMLHSLALGLAHPVTGRRVQFEAPVPIEIAHWFERGASNVFEDAALLGRALELAAARRAGLMRAYERGDTTVFRWVNGTGDGIPDTYLDVYDRYLVVRVDGDERTHDERMLGAYLAQCGFVGAYLKRHPRQANELVDPNAECFAPQTPLFGQAAPAVMTVHERGVPFEVHLNEGLRTGLFLDQRDNRALLQRLSPGKRVLNLFGYTGSFSVVAVAAGAQSVRTVDVSRAALAWAERNVAHVGGTDRHSSWAEDAFVALRTLHSRGEQFDRIVLDPPSYSTSKHGRFRAIKDYPALCAAAFRVLAKDGVLIACVNHHGIALHTLRRFVQQGASLAECELASLRDLPTGRDFPAEWGKQAAMKSVLARRSDRAPIRSPSVDVKPRKRTQ